MPRPFLDARLRNPIILPDGMPHAGTVHLNRVIDHPNITVGDFSYYSGFSTPADYAAEIAPYLYPGAPERLSIGRFCQIASSVRIITSSANHAMNGFSTFPFAVFNQDLIASYGHEIGNHRDTVIGHDVWLGFESVVMPGVRIGRRQPSSRQGVVHGRRARLCGSWRQPRAAPSACAFAPRGWNNSWVIAGGTGTPTGSSAISTATPASISVHCAAGCLSREKQERRTAGTGFQPA